MMDRKLSKQEILYLLDHLESLYSGASLKLYLGTEEICSGEGKPVGNKQEGSRLLFPLSDKGLDLGDVLTLEGIPVLFPCSNQESGSARKGSWYIFTTTF